MPFDTLENSLAGGQPFRLFWFQRGSQQWTFSSGDRVVTHALRTYQPVRGGITLDGGISQGGESGTNSITIVAPADLDVAQQYRGIPPSDAVSLVIYDRHVGDDDYRVSWIGEIQSVNWPSSDRCNITCLSENVSLQQQGLRLRWERSCPHCLYERGCNVNRFLYAVSGTILTLDAGSIILSSAGGYPSGWFNAGYVEWPVGSGNMDRRAIESHTGATLTLFGGTSGLVLGSSITAYPGCDQTPNTCNTKFGNMLNYGGIRHLPGRSPFDGNPFF